MDKTSARWTVVGTADKLKRQDKSGFWVRVQVSKSDISSGMIVNGPYSHPYATEQIDIKEWPTKVNSTMAGTDVRNYS